ncbi:MAG: hypothetical protein ACI9WS_000029 [Paraglaciecola psychrophila]|jgi:hypothetical protein
MLQSVRIAVVCCLSLALFSQLALSQKNAHRELYPDRSELENLKGKYRSCVMKKGAQLILVSDFDTAVKYAPKACKREFLAIRRFFFGNPFQLEISNELLSSVDEGIEIDLINYLIKVMMKK